MIHKKGYLMVELVLLMAIQTLFLTLFFTNQARLLQETSGIIDCLRTLNKLLVAKDLLTCNKSVTDGAVTVQEYRLTRPVVKEGSSAGKLRFDMPLQCHLLSSKARLSVKEQLIHIAIKRAS